MDIGFEFCQFFSEKIEEGSKELEEQHEEKGEQHGEELDKKKNYEFYGLFLGYVVSILICWVIHGRTVKVPFDLFRNSINAAGMLIIQQLDCH